MVPTMHRNAVIMFVLIAALPLALNSIRIRKSNKGRSAESHNASNNARLYDISQNGRGRCVPTRGHVTPHVWEKYPILNWLPTGLIHSQIQALYHYLATLPSTNNAVDKAIKQMATKYTNDMIKAQNVEASVQKLDELDWDYHQMPHETWFDLKCLIMDIKLKIDQAPFTVASNVIKLRGGMRAGFIEEATYMPGMMQMRRDPSTREFKPSCCYANSVNPNLPSSKSCFTGYKREGMATGGIQVVKYFKPGTKVASAVLLKAMPGVGVAADAKGTPGEVIGCEWVDKDGLSNYETGGDARTPTYTGQHGTPLVQVRFHKNFGTRWMEVWELRHNPLAIYSSSVEYDAATEVLPPVWRPHCITHGIPPGDGWGIDRNPQIHEKFDEERDGIPYFHVTFDDNNWLGKANAASGRLGSHLIRDELCLTAISGMRSKAGSAGASFMSELRASFFAGVDQLPFVGNKGWLKLSDKVKPERTPKNLGKECAAQFDCVPAHGAPGITCTKCGGYRCDGPLCHTMRRYIPDERMINALRQSKRETIVLHYERGVALTSVAKLEELQAQVAANRKAAQERWFSMAETDHKFIPWEAGAFWGDCTFPGWVRIGPDQWVPEWDPNGVRLLKPLSYAGGCIGGAHSNNVMRPAKTSSLGPTAEQVLDHGIHSVLNAWVGDANNMWSEASGVDITPYLPIELSGDFWKVDGVKWVLNNEKTSKSWNDAKTLGALPIEVGQPVTPEQKAFAETELKAQNTERGLPTGGEKVTLSTFYGPKGFDKGVKTKVSFSFNPGARSITLHTATADGTYHFADKHFPDFRGTHPVMYIEWRPTTNDGKTPPNGWGLQPVPLDKVPPYDGAKCTCGGQSNWTAMQRHGGDSRR